MNKTITCKRCGFYCKENMVSIYFYRNLKRSKWFTQCKKCRSAIFKEYYVNIKKDPIKLAKKRIDSIRYLSFLREQELKVRKERAKERNNNCKEKQTLEQSKRHKPNYFSKLKADPIRYAKYLSKNKEKDAVYYINLKSNPEK